MTSSEDNEENSRIAMFEMDLSIVDLVLNKEMKIKKHKFTFGYASILLKDQIQCYFAIQVKKDLLDKIDETIFFEIMGDIPFIMDYGDSLLYLRTKFDKEFYTGFKSKDISDNRKRLTNLLKSEK